MPQPSVIASVAPLGHATWFVFHGAWTPLPCVERMAVIDSSRGCEPMKGRQLVGFMLQRWCGRGDVPPIEFSTFR